MKERCLLFLAIFLIPVHSCFSQAEDASILLKSGKSSFRIANHKNYSLGLSISQESDSLKSCSTLLQGKLLSVSSGELRILPRRAKLTKIRFDSTIQFTETIYPKHANPLAVKVDDISMIACQSKSAHNCLVAGKTLTIISLVTTFVIAPLISINYNSGTMNTPTYFKFAAAGIGMYLVSIPLFLCSDEKHFYLKLPNNSKEKLWQITR